MIEIKTGRYDNLTLEQYHKECPGWSKSSLDKVHRSMAHYFCKTKEKTESLAFGAAFHCAILTPDLFDKQYCVMPNIDRRTNAGKAAYSQFQLENVGKEIITQEQSEHIKNMHQSIYDHPIAYGLFEKGAPEVSFFWNDEDTGILCKCRPDFIRIDDICIELKSTKDASYDKFKKDVLNYRYHVQNAYFFDGINAAGGKCSEFYICAVEVEPPYNVNIFQIEDQGVALGRQEYKKDLEIVKKYYGTEPEDRWAGYNPKIQLLHIPMWAK